MKTKGLFLTIAVLLWLCFLPVSSQPTQSVRHYDESDGLPHWNISQVLQDDDGFVWFGTWNGLCRFDGYKFQSFKPQAGDGCTMSTDRIRNIALGDSGLIYCKVDEQYYVFSTRTGKFRDALSSDETAIQKVMGSTRHKAVMVHGSYEYRDHEGNLWTISESDGYRFAMPDRQGNLWLLEQNGFSVMHFSMRHAFRFPMERETQVRCLFRDRQQRYWVGTREDGTVRLFDADNRLLGYLGRDGRLHANYCQFGSPVYCMTQDRQGTLWIGSKPDGLFRLTESAPGIFRVEHLELLSQGSVYDIQEDAQGRLWVATFEGLFCLVYCKADVGSSPVAGNVDGCDDLTLMPVHSSRVRRLHFTQSGLLVAATTCGLLVGDVSGDMHFRLHVKDSRRAASLSCNAVMDVVEDGRGNLYVGTETGGINRTSVSRLNDSIVSFEHFDTHTGLPTDVIVSLAVADSQLVVTSSRQLMVFNPLTQTATSFSSHYFGFPCNFSEAHPLQLPDGRWVFGLKDGAFAVSLHQLRHSSYNPPLVLTSLSRRSGQWEYAVNGLQSITLQPDERYLTVSFAALDYRLPDQITYEFRLCDDDAAEEPWHAIGHNHSVTLPDLRPGHYQLQIRSSNADGRLADNLRTLDITVEPTFMESVWGKLLLLVLLLAVIGGTIYTLLYIRRIKHRQHETLEAYLKLLESTSPTTQETEPEQQEDPMLQRVMAFIEENIGNSDAGVGDMAAAAAISRSGLQRKLKQAMGITPLDLLREARIKRACQLLTTTELTVSEVAYRCGFTDPKYFSRCFKSSVGQSPSDFKNTDKKGV